MRNYFYFKNNTKEDIKELKNIIKKAVQYSLSEEGFEQSAEISVTLTDNEGIKELNAQYRGKDKATDVLSFPSVEDDEEFYINPANGAFVLGDIVISLEMANAQANEYAHSPSREVAFLTVHSVLHLLGYDHEISKDEEEIMFQKQEIILEKAGFLR